MKANIGLIILVIVGSLLLFSMFQPNTSFIEYAEGKTIYFHSTNDITIIDNNVITVYKQPTLTIYQDGTAFFSIDRTFFMSIFAYDYDFPDFIIRTPKTITVTFKERNYIDCNCPNPAVFTVSSSKRTIYFTHYSTTMTIIRR